MQATASTEDLFLRTTSPERVRSTVRLLCGFAAAALLLDAASAAALLLSVHPRLRGITLPSLSHFTTDAVDVALLAALRLFVFPSVALLAAWLGRQPPPEVVGSDGVSPHANGHRHTEDDLREPLLPVSVLTPAEALRSRFAADSSLLFRRNVALAALFALCTASSVFSVRRLTAASRIRSDAPCLPFALAGREVCLLHCSRLRTPRSRVARRGPRPRRSARAFASFSFFCGHATSSY